MQSMRIQRLSLRMSQSRAETQNKSSPQSFICISETQKALKSKRYFLNSFKTQTCLELT